MPGVGDRLGPVKVACEHGDSVKLVAPPAVEIRRRPFLIGMTEKANKRGSKRVSATERPPAVDAEPKADEAVDSASLAVQTERLLRLVEQKITAEPHRVNVGDFIRLLQMRKEIDEKRRIPGYRARRWVVERTHSLMNRFRRLLIRWEKKAENYLAMLYFACALITFRAI